VRTRPDGGHDGQVVREYLFNCLQPAEPILGTRDIFGAALSQKVGAGAQVTYDGPGAAPSREAGAGAAESRDGPGAAPSREAGAEAVGTRDGLGAASSQEARAGGTRTREALELPRAGRREPLS
jgi:hypothetical protein